jgi:hypothetical protein
VAGALAFGELAVGSQAGGCVRGLDERPPEVGGSVLGQRATALVLARLVHARAQARVADQLAGLAKRVTSPISEAIV